MPKKVNTKKLHIIKKKIKHKNKQKKTPMLTMLFFLFLSMIYDLNKTLKFVLNGIDTVQPKQLRPPYCQSTHRDSIALLMATQSPTEFQ